MEDFRFPNSARSGGSIARSALRTAGTAHVGLDGATYVLSHDGTKWSAPTKLGGTTDAAPALTVRGSLLDCAVRGLDNTIWIKSLNSTTWSNFSTAPGTSTLSEAALTSGTGGSLHVGYRPT